MARYHRVGLIYSYAVVLFLRYWISHQKGANSATTGSFIDACSDRLSYHIAYIIDVDFRIEVFNTGEWSSGGSRKVWLVGFSVSSYRPIAFQSLDLEEE